MTRRRLLLAATLATLTVAGGCGYSLERPFPDDAETIFVPVWGRGQQVYRRGLEMRITEAVVKQINLRTDYRVSERPRADTELTGTLESVEQRILSYNPDTGRPREMEMTLVVSFTWKDLRTGENRLIRSNFAVSGTYIPHEPFGRDFFLGSEDVINKLARRVVEQMESPWPEPEAAPEAPEAP